MPEIMLLCSVTLPCVALTNTGPGNNPLNHLCCAHTRNRPLPCSAFARQGSQAAAVSVWGRQGFCAQWVTPKFQLRAIQGCLVWNPSRFYLWVVLH